MKKLIVTFLAVGFILASCAQPTSDDINTIVAVPEKTEEVKEEPKVDTSKDIKKEEPVVTTPEEVKKEEPKEDKWILAEKNENPDKGFKSTEFVYYPFGYDFPSYLNDSKLYSSGKIKLEFVETLTASNVDDLTVIFRDSDNDNKACVKMNKYKVLISKDVTEEKFLLYKGVGINIYSRTDFHTNPGFYQLKKVEGKWYLSQKEIVEDTISLYH